MRVTFTLTMAVTGSGGTDPAAGIHAYPQNTTVTLTATPAAGWQFVSWAGDVTNTASATTTITMSGNKVVTANFAAVTPTPASGGGGGSMPLQYTNPNGMSAQGTISSDGKVLGTIAASSKDKSVTLTIAAYTTAKDGNNHPLSRLDISPLDSPPPVPTGVNLIGVPYEFGPSGTTFSPPVPLTWEYDPKSIPEGVEEANLQPAGNSTWVPLEDATVDTEHHMITVRISHFSTYAIIGRQPATFEYGKLTVTPAEAALPDSSPVSITITTSVANTGGYPGNQTLILKINDKEMARQEVALDPGASQEIEFKQTMSEPGTYSVDLNGLTGEFVIKPRPASFTTSEIALSSSEIYKGENSTVSTVVTNTGGSPGTYKIV